MKKFSVETVLKVYIVLLFLLSLPVSAYAGLDSTSFTPPETIEPSGGGVPVGTIVAWPVATNPKDAAKWLECNGQAVSQAVYPKLYAIVGPTVPDYRGLFLRGYGGNSGALGVLQSDQFQASKIAMNINGSTRIGLSHLSVPTSGNINVGLITFTESRYPDDTLIAAHPDGGGAPRYGNETRPINKAVRYLIRAKD